MRMKSLIMIALMASGAVLTGNARASASDAQIDDPVLPTGWKWELGPNDLFPHWTEQSFSAFVDSGYISVTHAASGDVLIDHVRTKDVHLTGSEAPRYEVYLWTRDGERVPSTGMSSMSNGKLVATKWRFRHDDPSQIVRIGVAALDFEGRKALAEESLAEAKSSGASVIPLPVLGMPLEFDLPTMDGGRIRSADLRGKVVLIDFWATWCGPCMAKMPQLKKVIQDYGDELVVIGVGMDEDVDKARSVIEEHNFDWPQVNASLAANGNGDLWEQVTGIHNIPRVLVLDREGVVRLDAYPFKLVDQMAPFFEENEDGR